MQNELTLFPIAKINLGLFIVRQRADGYHDLETCFYPIHLHDTLRFVPTDAPSELREQGLVLDCAKERNLVWRTMQIFEQQFHTPSVRLELTKQIPFGAGLGGGSSDAAYTALGYNQLFDLRLTPPQLKALVRPLGADCAFFIDSVPSLATGIGDRLQRCRLSLKDYALVLVKPTTSVSTQQAYAQVRPQVPPVPLATLLEQDIKTWKKELKNDFEPSVFALFPEIEAIKNQLYALGAVYASMSGSGSSVFGLFEKGTFDLAAAPALFAPHFVYTEQLNG